MSIFKNIEFMETVVAALVAIIGWALRAASQRSERRETYAQAIDLVESEVKFTLQTFVDERKKRSADGTLTDQEKQEAFELTKKRVLSTTVPHLLQFIKGLGEDWIKTRIESSVKDAK